MSKSLSFQEFGNLLMYIRENNSPLKRSKLGGPTVKYIDPIFDMRSNTVFSVVLRGFGTRVVFTTTNESMHLKESLEERIRKFLDTPLTFDSFKEASPK